MIKPSTLGKIATAALALAGTAVGTAAGAQSTQPLDGCSSAPIAQRFTEFGKTGKMPEDLGKWLNDPEQQAIEPWKAFDNVDYVGICWVSAWLVHTSDGVVLIDTLYGQFTDRLIENIKTMGVDLADIKYVLMTHGHFDHVGGAAKLKPLLPNARFVMTQAGWDEAAEGAAESDEGPNAFDMIEPDMVVADGDQITLGDETFTVMETPGHTWGTASYLYDVKDGDQTYRAITIGGLGLNAIDGPSQVEAYIDSVDKVEQKVRDAGDEVKVHLSTHGFSNNLYERHLKLKDRKPGDPNPLVDQQGLEDQLDDLRDGARDRLEEETGK